MPLKTIIQCPKSGLSAEVVDHAETNALAVATRPLKTYENTIRFFLNDDYGADMNVNAATGGTPDKIHDGTDSVLWTASDIVGGGKTTFDSTDQNHTAAGTKSIKVDNSPVNDIFQIAKGSDIDLTGYVSLSMWVYVDKDWKGNDSVSVYGWDTDTATPLGNEVYLEDYFAYDTYDVWQKILIPLTDMSLESLTTLDAIRFKQEAKEGAKAPKYYLDDIQFEQTGTPIEFTLKPDKQTWLIVDEFTISVADAFAGTLLNGTMPAIPYDAFLGVSLTVGITYQRTQGGDVQFSQQVINLLDFMQLAGTEVVGTGSDGTNTWMTMRARHIEPIVLKAETLDKLKFTVNDDMSGLLRFRISAGCKVEDREIDYQA